MNVFFTIFLIPISVQFSSVRFCFPYGINEVMDKASNSPSPDNAFDSTQRRSEQTSRTNYWSIKSAFNGNWGYGLLLHGLRMMYACILRISHLVSCVFSNALCKQVEYTMPPSTSWNPLWLREKRKTKKEIWNTQNTETSAIYCTQRKYIP